MASEVPSRPGKAFKGLMKFVTSLGVLGFLWLPFEGLYKAFQMLSENI
jgi:hypothetical protein